MGSPSLTYRGGHLSPLQHHILDDPPVSVDVDALVFIAQQHLHAVSVGEEDDGMGRDLALDLGRRWLGGVRVSEVQNGLVPSPHSPVKLTWTGM